MRLRDRVFMSDVLGDYVPDYRYLLFRLQEHGDAELIAKRDEISLIMLINELVGVIHSVDSDDVERIWRAWRKPIETD